MTKYLLPLLFLLALLPAAHAQIGFNSPPGVTIGSDMELYSRGTFIVQQKYRPSTTNPQASTAVIFCGRFAPYRDTQAGIMTDPSNFSTYSATTDYRCSQKVQIYAPASETIVGIEITFLQFDLGPQVLANNDYLTISSPSVTSMPGFLGTTLPGRIVIPDNEFTVTFWATPDGTGGRGFRLQWRALYADNSQPDYSSNSANTNQFRFNTQTGALLAGVPPDFRGWRLGAGSVSIGDRNRATGEASAAIGRENATGAGDGFGYGRAAIAMGYSNYASGDYSAAIGNDNYTISNSTIALGYRNRISGEFGVGIGNSNAAGLNAIALGFTNGVGGDYAVGIGRNNGVGSTNGVAIGSYNFVPTSTTNAVAIGHYNNSVGQATMAFGTSLNVGSPNAVAIGNTSTSNGQASMTFGSLLTASNTNAMAFGLQNTSSGISSLAMGYLNTASGNYSTALGHRMNTNNQAGAFMIGDSDPLAQGTTGAGAADQFVARFRNGYYFMTSGTGIRTGIFAGAGQNAWGSISDSTKKERLLPMNHAELLYKIGGMKLSSWNYKGQRDIRHYGPMAQDFYAAFGHDGLGQIGCDTLIYSHDFAGVTFAGVQALVRENERLHVETQDLASQVRRLKEETQDLASLQARTNQRLELLEQAMLGRKRVVRATPRTRTYSR